MKILIALLSSCIMSVAFAQKPLTEHTITLDTSLEKSRVSVEQLHFLTGQWEGEGLGGKVQEQWSPVEASSMIGSFRLIDYNENDFFELLLIEETEFDVVYKVKHFSKAFEAWEEKKDFTSFQLLKVTGDTAYFDGLTIVVEEDQCTQFLAMKQKDGTYKELKFVLQRVRELPVDIIFKDTVEGLAVDSLEHTVKRSDLKNQKIQKYFKNTSDRIIIISRAYTNDPHFICDYPKKPILPGDVYSFTVCFANRTGPVHLSVGFHTNVGEIRMHIKGSLDVTSP